jgi:hypothetical protein
MIDKPINPVCPNCLTSGIDNLNMIITLTTEQPLKYFHSLPSSISLSPKTSHNSSWVNWDSPHASIICRNCGYSSTDPDDFEGPHLPERMSYGDDFDS